MMAAAFTKIFLAAQAASAAQRLVWRRRWPLAAPSPLWLFSAASSLALVLLLTLLSLSALAIFAPSQKWSKGKVKEKLANLVLFDKTTYEKMLTDVPKQKLITPSIISEKLKVNGSLARKAVRELVSKGLIRPVLTHKQQQIFTRATNQ